MYSSYGAVPPPGAPYSDPGMYGSDPYGHQPGYGQGALVPMGHRFPTHGYDDMDGRDYEYDSYGHGHGHGQYSGAMMPSRSRRHSTASYLAVPAPQMDTYPRGTGQRIKFKRKGALMGGIGLDEAQGHVRLSNNDGYTYHDLHADRRRVLLRVKWSGYNSMTYEIPLDGWDRRVSLETLARRVSRACVHYLQANVIPILWDRVVLHHLEEVSYGVWQPMLSTR